MALVLVPGSMSASDAGEQAAAAEVGALGIALAHLRGNAAEAGVTSADLTDLSVTSQYTSRHNG
ncbi:MAG TPA: hypothetical protein VK915_03760, partial [Gaiellaceae bacterium]|nr:hypothetical protein [Gaiellaceae bacterium]